MQQIKPNQNKEEYENIVPTRFNLLWQIVKL